MAGTWAATVNSEHMVRLNVDTTDNNAPSAPLFSPPFLHIIRLGQARNPPTNTIRTTVRPSQWMNEGSTANLISPTEENRKVTNSD